MRIPAQPRLDAAHGIFSRALVAALILFAASRPARAAEAPGAAQFRHDILPLLSRYCFDCHADGANKGKVSFDEFKSDSELLGDHDLWQRAMKNLRADLMPPAGKPRPTAEERKVIDSWIKYQSFGIDPRNPDPGRVTVRRLNRIEYRNTIHELMGVDFNSEMEFPPDDTGYGFDNIGDVLTVSPMLLEKYMAAAKTVVAQAVPVVARVEPEMVIAGNSFQGGGAVASSGNTRNRRETFTALSYYKPGSVSNEFKIEIAGDYKVTLEIAAKGNFDYDPGRCEITFVFDGQELVKREFGWYDNKTFRFDFDQKLALGEHRMTVALKPLVSEDKRINSLDMRVASVTVRGPADQKYWTHPKNYERFFTRDAPASPSARREFAHEVLAAFAAKAFRRPVESAVVDRLVTVAEKIYTQPGKSVEAGIAHAMVAVLSSPRFLFRLEQTEPAARAAAVSGTLSPASTTAAASFPLVDEYALASRLSYFLWSTMPDDELLGLAGRHELRKNMMAQVKRMLADPRSEALILNFTGQWLQTRDVDGTTIDARTIFARDSGTEKQMRQQAEEFRARFAQRTNQVQLTNSVFGTNAPGFTGTNFFNGTNAFAAGTNGFGGTNRFRGQNRPGRFARPPIELDRDLRQAMHKETEMFVSSIIHEDRDVMDLLDSNYTFVNEKLATLYGLTNVTGTEMRRVELPPDSPRGGVLTHGSVLVVTSNPDRTSPVKRGLFVLDNVIGTPAPPPPPNIPALEAAEKDFKDHDPTLREALELHRAKPLCASCHNRMDPIGLAFENFNALGKWRDKERGQAIDTAGKLITGETFTTVKELKHILVTNHRMDFYRCLSEKLLTYALGRGMEYSDAETLDQIVARLERENGRFSALLLGIIESAPFQKQRDTVAPVSVAAAPSSTAGAEVASTRTAP